MKVQKKWQHRVHKTKKNKAKTQHNICWTPLCANQQNNVNKTVALIQTNGNYINIQFIIVVYVGSKIFGQLLNVEIIFDTLVVILVLEPTCKLARNSIYKYTIYSFGVT